MIDCNICGGSKFAPGPFGRMSIGGLPPRCLGCGSLERHRIMRRAIEAFRDSDVFATLSLMRFSADPIVDPSWFKSSELSTFEGENSLDIQAIDRPDEAYDVVVCSHVIEHVADDRNALRELLRIVSRRGFLILAYPRAEKGGSTVDWGYADPARNFHYRGYGSDFDTVMSNLAVAAIGIENADLVTGDRKRFNILSKSNAWSERILERVAGAKRL